MTKRFGAWSKRTAREKAEYYQELRDNLKNGPVIITHLTDKVTDDLPDASTDDDNSIFFENDPNE
jgi:hypothetical protein